MSVASAVNHFAQSLAGIAFSLWNAVWAILNAFIALAQELLSSAFKLVQATGVLLTELVQDTVGFVFSGPVCIFRQTIH